MDYSGLFSGLNLSRGKSLQHINPVPRPNFRPTKLSGRPLIAQIHKSLKNLKLAPTLPILPSASDTKPHLIPKVLPNSSSLDLKPINTSRPSNKLKIHSKNTQLVESKALNTNLNTPTFYNGFFNTNEVQDKINIDSTKSVFNARFKLSLNKAGISLSCKKFSNINNLLTATHRKPSINLSNKRIRVLNHPLAKDVFTFNP